MSGLSRILGAAEAFKAPSVVVVARLCTHRHHQASSCSRCVDVCPAQAVTVSAEGPSVDALSCADCGACVSVCPTGALAALRPTDRRLVEQITAASEPGKRMMLACARAPAGDPGAVKVGCLARLDPSLLLTAFSHEAGAITLCTGACETCSVKEAATRLSSVAADTRRILELFDLPGRIDIEERQGRSQTDADRDREPATREARSRPGGLGSTVITRRGFFGILRHGGTYAAATAAGVLTGQEEAVVDEGPRRELLVLASSKRERLLEALRLLVAETAPPPEADVLFVAPQLDSERCDLCGLCGRLCPTGALTLAEGEGGGPLCITCRPEACVSCRLCEEVCGRQALTLAPVPAARVLARAPEPVVLMKRRRNDVEPVQVAFEDKIRVGFEDKLQTLLGTPVYRS